MKKILKILDRIIAQFFIILIRIYQFTLSPDKWFPSLRLKWKVCAHEPHCSEYGILTLKRYWFYKWIYKVMDRIFRCKPSYCKQYDPEHYRVVFFSSAPIGVQFLEELYEDKRFEVVGVVTTPDKPVWRWLKIQKNIIKKTAEKHSSNPNTISTPNKIRSKSQEWKDFQSRLKSKNADFLVVIAYWKIIPQSILDIPNIAPINVHGSLLPEYRGASPIQSVFLDKKEITWITIMKMDSGLDTGNMIDKLKFKIQFQRTTLDIIKKIQKSGPKFLTKTLRNYWKKILWEVEQNEKQSTTCVKITKEDGEIHPQQDSLEKIYKKYRWYYLRPKIYFFIDQKDSSHNGKRIVIENLVLDEDIYQDKKSSSLFNGKKLNSAVKSISLKPEGKKSQNRESFLSGYWN